MENKNKKVVGPLTVNQFVIVLATSAIIYMCYLYFGYNQVFWIISGVVVPIALLGLWWDSQNNKKI